MSLSVVMAAASTAALVMTFGAAAPGTKAATEGTKTAFKTGAKATLRKFQEQVAQQGIKTAIVNNAKAAVKKRVAAITAEAVDEAVQDAIINAATVTMIEDLKAKDEGGIDEFDYTSLDVTGLASAIKTSVEGGTDLEQASAWTAFAGTFDPTGWVAAAASFMKPMCHEYTR